MRVRSVLVVSILFLAMFGPMAAAQNVGNSPPAHALDICSLIASPAEYDGKEVIVTSLYRMIIHGAILMGKGCSDVNISAKETDDYKADKHASDVLRRLLKKDRFGPVEIVVRGTFHLAHQGQCFGGEICSRYQVEIAELLSAQPVTPQSATTPDAPTTDTLLHESGHVDPPKPQ